MMVNTGVILESPRPRDWIFGAVTGAERKVQNIISDWRSSVPPGELQKREGFESMSCVSQATCNDLEILINSIYGIPHEQADRADRALATMSGTTEKGNSFISVAETVKSSGVPHETKWPWPKVINWENFYSKVSDEAIKDGLQFRNTYKPQYEWVWPRSDGQQAAETMKDALKYGPLLACNTYHAFVIVAVDGPNVWVFDSYDPFLKTKPIGEIEAAMLFSIAQSDTNYTPPLEILDDCLIFESGGAGRFALHLKGKLFVDVLSKIQAQWIMRNSKDDYFSGGPTRNILSETFNAFRQLNLKNQPINF